MSNSTSRVRTRLTPLKQTGAHRLGYYNSAITQGGVPTGQWSPVQTNIQDLSVSYPLLKIEYCVDELHEGPPYFTGGLFRYLKQTVCSNLGATVGKGTYVRSDKKLRYVGGFGTADGNLFGTGGDFSLVKNGLGPSPSLFPSMGDWGSRAWSATKPRIEGASAFVFASELRDMPRQLKTTSRAFHDIWRLSGGNQTARVMKPKNVSDHFLNFEFGWKPFLSDLRKFDYVIQNYNDLVEKRIARNNKFTRRRKTLSGGSETTKIDEGIGYKLDPFLPGDFFTGTPTWELFEDKTWTITAVGSFRVYVPEFDEAHPQFYSRWGDMMRFLDVTGLRTSPSNIYKATPWTWAIDWATNMGDHVDRVNDYLIDSLACKYCYVMQHVQRTRRFRTVLPFLGGTVILEFLREIETKQRDEASSPFGFSRAWEDLTPRQVAIAGALGINRR